MRAYKKFLSLVIFAAVIGLAVPGVARAELPDCLRWLVGKPLSEAGQRRAIWREAKRDYKAFLRQRRHNKLARPPGRLVTRTTSNDDLLLSFHYWWYPGNIWHVPMTQEFGDLGRTYAHDQEVSVVPLPALESLSPIESLGISVGDVPTNLPEPSAGDGGWWGGGSLVGGESWGGGGETGGSGGDGGGGGGGGGGE